MQQREQRDKGEAGRVAIDHGEKLSFIDSDFFPTTVLSYRIVIDDANTRIMIMNNDIPPKGPTILGLIKIKITALFRYVCYYLANSK